MPAPVDPTRARSSVVVDGRDRAAARSFYHAVGFNDEDLAKPLVLIANTWTDAMPCNFGLRALADHVKAGVRAAGGTPMEFNTIAISDGITMGTEGMKASLVSREVIADSIELVARGYGFDAIVALVACDKTIPAAGMALLRLDIPGLALYGGSIAPGRYKGRDLTIGDVFEAIGEHAAGKIDDAETKALLKQVHRHFLPNTILILADGSEGQKYLGEKNEAIRAMSTVEGKPAAYVCENFTCKAPVTDPKALSALFSEKH